MLFSSLSTFLLLGWQRWQRWDLKGCWQKQLAFLERFQDIQLNRNRGSVIPFGSSGLHDLAFSGKTERLELSHVILDMSDKVVQSAHSKVSWGISWKWKVVVWTWQCQRCWGFSSPLDGPGGDVIYILFHKCTFSCLMNIFKKSSKYTSILVKNRPILALFSPILANIRHFSRLQNAQMAS